MKISQLLGIASRAHLSDPYPTNTMLYTQTEHWEKHWIDGFPVLTDILEYQTSVIDENKKPRQIEIDLMCRNNNNILLIGECKFKNLPFDKMELDKLLEKARYIPASDPQICVFSLSGFTEEVIKNSASCRLISLDDMY